jgi:hypothetical protein
MRGCQLRAALDGQPAWRVAGGPTTDSGSALRAVGPRPSRQWLGRPFEVGRRSSRAWSAWGPRGLAVRSRLVWLCGLGVDVMCVLWLQCVASLRYGPGLGLVRWAGLCATRGCWERLGQNDEGVVFA